MAQDRDHVGAVALAAGEGVVDAPEHRRADQCAGVQLHHGEPDVLLVHVVRHEPWIHDHVVVELGSQDRYVFLVPGPGQSNKPPSWA